MHLSQISNQIPEPRQSIEEKVLDLMGFWENYKENRPPTLTKSRSSNKKLSNLPLLKSNQPSNLNQSSPRLIYPKKLSIKRKGSLLIANELIEKFERCRSDLHNDLKHKKKPGLFLKDMNLTRQVKK